MEIIGRMTPGVKSNKRAYGGATEKLDGPSFKFPISPRCFLCTFNLIQLLSGALTDEDDKNCNKYYSLKFGFTLNFIIAYIKADNCQTRINKKVTLITFGVYP